MKSVILFALVAFVAASPVYQQSMVPVQQLPNQYPVDQYNFYKQPYGQEGDTYQVAQYIAYLFHQVQQRGYTPLQFSEYLIQHGFPQNIVKYLSEQYEYGLSKPYLQAPYELFRYYSSQKFSPDFKKYLLDQIERVYQQLQIFWPQYGYKSYEQEFTGVPQPISQYTIGQAQYHQSSGLTYAQAQLIYQQLLQVENYAQNVMKYFVDRQVSQEMYPYIYKQLQQVLQYIPKALNAYQVYASGQQVYLPYYAAQNYIEQANQVYHYFQNIYNYIQQQGLVAKLPEYFVEQIRLGYFAAQKVYQPTFQYQNENPEYSLKQVLYYIQLVQQYIQTKGAFPEYNVILQQLNQAYQYYQVYQQQHGQQYLQQAYQYLQQAYVAAQKVNQIYILEQLQYALNFAGKLQQLNYQEFPSVYQYTQNILNEFRQYVAQGVIPQQYASYIIQQLEQILRYSYNVPNQYVWDQVQVYFQNILRYVREQQVKFPEFVGKFLIEKIQYVLQYFPQQQSYEYQQYGPYQMKSYQYEPFRFQSSYPGQVQQYQYAPRYQYGTYQVPYKYEQPFPSAA
ncbi:uncharacterized protein LOC126746902 [Anthonomus grandis grandis]|uniref:uncharacterized protein LOC126746902 n=1 Tax=Anthonomus grandis grandis TaxID=2921223 RepID=UPI002165E902|nr:uncharacterized protein LOC126746902 [Anthonomus grandis grandis]